ncbi:MAG: hypothetical protein LBN04_10865 [Oscillospiraceae bacterium]|jgi:hypothetical protein|nr:hypothetical protein [Oscillospiraceae bacterium]
MREKLAVSDSLNELVAVLSLPDLEVMQQARVSFAPGRLCAGQRLYCADVSAPTIHALNPETLAEEGAFAAAPELEALRLSENALHIYALSGGADSLQKIECAQGRLLHVARVGVRPGGFSQDAQGRCLVVAGGAAAEVTVLDSATLGVCASYPVGGAASDACFFAGQLMVLCAIGDYEMRTLVGAIGPDGQWKPWAALSGLPGAMAPCGGGLLVGHMRTLTMLDPPNGRIRWQTKIAGLPTEIVPAGRAACFADGLDGLVGLIDLRRGTVLRRMRLGEPGGLAVMR